ncbi:putative ABC transport system permease protein [Azonexus fungiphilus]|uniref:Putative ABC transport system permease protein n=1 Tax=Azonexus fungiphilus TaxID=146940 RepID=A0A495WI45_9RHOO|nr:ABC transporter permease [Azonexus fungiphilus]RKT59538.1 putative ABC transport system permease protein [Azonexus fungiphilus]
MRALLRLALASAWNRRLGLGLTLLSVMLAATLLLSVERVRQAARASFAQSVSATDLVVGARSSPVQLVLHAVFHLGEPTGNLGWDSYRKIAADPAIAWSVPLSLGDSHRGYPVLGTTPDYFVHFRYGDRQPLSFASGAAFAGIFEAVLGAEVAARLGYRVGERITLSHGDGGLAGMEHEDKPFTVVGILAPTGTPVDRSVHVGLAAIEAIHLDWIGGAPVPGFSIGAEVVQKFDLTPKSITAFLVGLHRRGEVFAVQRRIGAFAGEPLTAVLPGVALDQLWQSVGFAERALQVLSWLVLAVGLAGLAATMLAGLDQRRRELAILRSLGAGRRHLLALLVLESGVVSLLGCLLGLAATTLLALFGAGRLAAFGLSALPLTVAAGEMQLLAAVLVCGLLVGLLPAWRAYRLSLADGLTPRC